MAVVVAATSENPRDCDGSSHNGMSTLRFGGKEMLEPHRKARGAGWRADALRKARNHRRGRERDGQRATASTPEAFTLVPVRCPLSGSGPQTWLCFLWVLSELRPFSLMIVQWVSVLWKPKRFWSRIPPNCYLLAPGICPKAKHC